ncbi:MAG: hypothetical protein V1904_06330 [Bacteroidota bacterium]
MKDTPDHIIKKQFEIIYSKPIKERFLMTFDMIEFARKQAENNIRSKNPLINDTDLMIAVFILFYDKDLPVQTKNNILNKMRLSH